MTEISERYARLADAFAAKITSVPSDRWAAQSPCEGWTARDVVGHVVSSQGLILGLVGRSLGDMMRSPQAFGPEVEAPAGADEQGRLLAFLGRTP
jgi:uncharacterized protein (TIGR03083 family)